MKKIIILIITPFIIFIGCYKEVAPKNESEIVSLIKEKEPNFSVEEYREVVSSKSESYDINDLLSFLALYGTTIPDILPAFNNYYQDISGGGSNLGNLTLLNGSAFLAPGNVVLQDTTNYKFDWYINGVLQCSEANPKLWDLDDNLECDGVVELKLRVTDNVYGTVFERTQWAYIDYNYINSCNCPECPPIVSVFYTFYPDVDSYYYIVDCATWDLNCDNEISSSDLLIFLSNFGQ
jgi:hypothetical protein